MTSNIPIYIPELAHDTGISTPDTTSDIMPSTMILNVTGDNASIGLELVSFTFNVAFENKINIYNHVVSVVKLSDIPL